MRCRSDPPFSSSGGDRRRAEFSFDRGEPRLRRIATYLGQSGSYPAARNLWQLIADAYSEDDAYGLSTRALAVRASLARWTGHAGDPAAARDQYAALLPIVERVFGPSTQTPWPPATTWPTGPKQHAVVAGEAGNSYR